MGIGTLQLAIILGLTLGPTLWANGYWYSATIHHPGAHQHCGLMGIGTLQLAIILGLTLGPTLWANGYWYSATSHHPGAHAWTNIVGYWVLVLCNYPSSWGSHLDQHCGLMGIGTLQLAIILGLTLGPTLWANGYWYSATSHHPGAHTWTNIVGEWVLVLGI